MSDNPAPRNVIVNYILKTDQAQAANVSKTLKQHQQDIKATATEYRAFAREGQRIREVGTTIAAAGAGILAPFIAAASEYTRRYGQLEATSRSFLAAQQRQTDATSAFGRVAAAALVPTLNSVADITEKIAKFAQQHPDLVTTGINVGAALTAGGGVLIAIGQAQATLGRIQQIVTGGGLVGNIATAIVGIGAFAGGLKLGEAAVQAVGKASNNAALEHYKLADALQTARQLVGGALLVLAKEFVEAKKTLGEMGDIITAVAAIVQTKFETIIDAVSTGFKVILLNMQNGLAQMVNNMLDLLANIAGKFGNTELGLQLILAKDQNALPDQNGKTGYNRQADQLGADFKGRQAGRDDALTALGNQLGANQDARNKQYATDQANLAAFAKDISSFTSTGSLGPLLDGIVGGIGAKLQNVVNGITNAPGTKGATTSGAALPPEAVQDYLDYRKATVAADKQYAIDSAKITTDYNTADVKYKQDNADKLAQIDQETADNAQKIRDAQAKSIQDFNDSERQTDEKNALAKKQRQQALNDQLNDLEGQRDVAGFIKARRAGEIAEQNQTAQEALDKQQRKEQFDKTQAQFKQDLADNDAQGRKKRDQQNTQFANEERDRKSAYQQQLADLKTKHQQEDQTIEQHFAEQLAALSENVAGLHDIQGAYYTQAAIDAQNFVTSQRAILQQLYSASIGVSAAPNGGASGPSFIPPYNPPTYTAPVAGSPYIPTRHLNGAGFASGLNYVPRDGYYKLHTGEEVRNKEQARTGGGITVHVYNTVGDVATKSMLDSYQAKTVKAVVDGIKRHS